jgi:hypothetical protein
MAVSMILVAGNIARPIYVAMKTTLDISDPLLKDARRLAARDGTTLRALVEKGLRTVITESKQRTSFKLRDGSFKGKGLQPEFADAGWDEIRRAIYEGRGG